MAIDRTDQNWPDETTVDLQFCLDCYQWHSPKTLCPVIQSHPRPAVQCLGIPENWTQDDINRITGEIFDFLISRGLLKADPTN